MKTVSGKTFIISCIALLSAIFISACGDDNSSSAVASAKDYCSTNFRYKYNHDDANKKFTIFEDYSYDECQHLNGNYTFAHIDEVLQHKRSYIFVGDTLVIIQNKEGDPDTMATVLVGGSTNNLLGDWAFTTCDYEAGSISCNNKPKPYTIHYVFEADSQLVYTTLADGSCIPAESLMPSEGTLDKDESYTDTYAIYIPQWGNYNGKEVITSMVKQNKDEHTGEQGVGGSAYKQTIDFNAHFDYNRTFADVHNVSAMLLANGYQQSQSGEYHRTSNVNAGLLASYNYAHKYYAEFGSALIHSAKLAEGNRKGYSYSATAGWNIAREAFLEGSIFDDLKLSASYSVLSQDIDVENYGMYAPDFNNNHDVWWGWGVGDSQQATTSKRGSNKDLDYIKRKEFSVTLQGALLEKALTFEASYFRTTTEGLIIVPNNLYPSYFSTYWPEASFVPYTNYNDDLRYGFEVAVNYKKQLTDDEKAIFHIYKKTLQMARREDAVINGVFFDLMYVNQHLSRQYVFLRRAGSDLLLVAVNFDGNDADISVNIPTHAFDYLQLKERKGVAHDLLSSEKMSLQLKSDSAVNMNIGAYGARVWKMKA